MQTVAVIGTGNMGKGLAKLLADAGYQVVVGSRNAERAIQVAREIGSSVEGKQNIDAVKDAQVCFLAIPFQRDNDTLLELRDHLSGKIVVDISNPLNASYDGLTTPATTSAAELIAGYLPASKVVGAFKNTLAAVFAEPLFAGQKSAVFVAADDQEAKQTVLNLIQSLPFSAIDAGALSVARTIENMSVLLIQVSQKYQYNWRAAYQILA